MAEVFLARQRGSGAFSRLVVVKRLHSIHSTDPELEEALRHEAQLMTLLTHGNLVQILDFEEIEGAHYLVMEVVEGVSAADLLRKEERLPVAVAAAIVADAADGIHAAHELRDDRGRSLGFVHRDISPDNVLLGFDGRVKVADFGVALSRLGPRLTREGTVKGKVPYMSPEQLRGAMLDRLADVYSLGAVLYEFLSGAPPFDDAPSDVAQGYAILTSAPKPLPDSVPRAVRKLVMECLAKEPAQRPQSAELVSARLRSAVDVAPRRVLAQKLSVAFPADHPFRLRFQTDVGPAPQRRRSTPIVGSRLPALVREIYEQDVTGTDAVRRRGGWRRALRLAGMALAGLTVAAGASLLMRPRAAPTPPPPAPSASGIVVAQAPPLPPPAPPAGLSEVTAAPVPAAPVPPSQKSAHATRRRNGSWGGTRPSKLERRLSAAGSGAVIVQSSVPCGLSINGVPSGAASSVPRRINAVPAGTVALRCHNATIGLDLRRSLRLSAGGQEALDLSPKMGTLTIKVLPWGNVFLDGRDLGITPVAPQRAYEGIHRVRAVHPSGRHEEMSIRVEPDASAELRLSLREPPPETP
jgi:serine/threonine-protein kinase